MAKDIGIVVRRLLAEGRRVDLGHPSSPRIGKGCSSFIKPGRAYKKKSTGSGPRM